MTNLLMRFGFGSGPPAIPDYFLENGDLSEEQIDRKRRNERRLYAEGIPMNAHLPCIEDDTEVELRRPEEVYQRFFALAITASVAEEKTHGDMPHEELKESCNRWIDQKDVWSWFTDRESRYLTTLKTDPNEDLQLSWRYEAALPLYWAMGFGPDQFEAPVVECDRSALAIAAREDIDPVGVSLRPKTKILDEADLIYRYHWAARDASRLGKPSSGGLHPGVVMERHKALNWLIGYQGQDWEDISTDT